MLLPDGESGHFGGRREEFEPFRGHRTNRRCFHDGCGLFYNGEHCTRPRYWQDADQPITGNYRPISFLRF